MQYPVVLELDGRVVVVVGGGRVAERKVARLLEADADVLVVAPELSSPLQQLVARGEVRLAREAYRAEVVVGAALVFAATDDPAVNDQVVRDARAAGVWANNASGQEVGFIVPASGAVATGDGGPVIGVAAWSGSPAFSVRLRDELLELVDERWQRAARIFARLRAAIGRDRATQPSQEQRATRWRRLAAGVPARFETDDDAHQLLRELFPEDADAAAAPDDSSPNRRG